MTQDDPRVTQDDPRVTQEDLRVAQDDPGVSDFPNTQTYRNSANQTSSTRFYCKIQTETNDIKIVTSELIATYLYQTGLGSPGLVLAVGFGWIHMTIFT